MPEKIVVPAQAGTQASFHGGLTVTLPWSLFVEDSSIPRCGEFLDSRLRGHDGVGCGGRCVVEMTRRAGWPCVLSVFLTVF